MTAPAMRTQVDGLAEVVSLETAIDCSTMPDLARQEFKDETDVNKVLARYGVNTPLRQPEYSTVDYDMDLQQALAAIETAQEALRKLPPQLRQKYPTWETLLAGLYQGTFKTDLDAQLQKDQAALDAAAATQPSSGDPPQ